MPATASGQDRTDPRLPLLVRLTQHSYTPFQLAIIDAVVVAGIIALMLFGTTRHATVSGTGWTVAGWVGGAVTSVVVLGRRRWPWPTLIVVLAADLAYLAVGVWAPPGFYVLLALYSVVVGSDRRTALAVSAAVAACVAATVLAAGSRTGSLPTSVETINFVALIVATWLAGEGTRGARAYRRAALDQAAERAAAVAAEQQAELRQAVADERTEIARELHDIVAHAMSIIAVRAGVARMVIDDQPEQAREALQIIETTIRRSLHEMRLLVGVLRRDDERSAELAPAPGMSDLPRLLADIGAAGVTVDLNVDGPPRELSPAVDLTGYRIVQEALTNVVRHAGPTHARVALTYQPDELRIEVTDEGPPNGAAPPPRRPDGGGHGLIGMQERAALFGGSLDAGPSGRGFRVRANLHTNNLAATGPS